MSDLDTIGADWLIEEVNGLTDEIIHVKPSDFNEATRYLPSSVTPLPGYISYDVNPFMREILDCCDIDSPIREVAVKKGVQVTYTTLIESIMLYFMEHIKTLPMMYATADKELATARIENNIIPMINQSGLGHIIRSSDEGNSRKTGKTANHLQWEGGGYLMPFGAQNANKMRQASICILLLDEIDGYPDIVGKDGDPIKLFYGRTKAYTESRKIFLGSTPLIKGTSKIDKAYLRGDRRKYRVLCKSCGFPQELRWSSVNKDTGIKGGFDWELHEGSGLLIPESACYRCQDCGHAHYEHDKTNLFEEDHGAHWHPTAKPEKHNIRSYHLPAMYSPVGFQPWHEAVSDYLEAYDPIENKVKDIGAYQAFYNNILGESFEIMGAKISFTSVSLHRRHIYRFGEIPNEYAVENSGSPILFLTCQVDVHKENLAVAVMGWTRDAKTYVVDYWRFEARKQDVRYENGEIWEGETEKDYDCEQIHCPAWGRLRSIIEEKVYTADDGKVYQITMALVDAGYVNDTVTTFCETFEGGGVYPILGRDRPAKNQTIKEFSEFETQAGTKGYRILVDHYKDRMAPVLRREWTRDAGQQKPYHFNAPTDITDAQLRELTKESRKSKTDEKGVTTYFWYRKSGAKNELWDLLVYGHAAVEILAWSICKGHFELETIDWRQFWDYVEFEAKFFVDVDKG